MPATIPCLALAGAACQCLPWRQGERQHVAVVVKATLALAPRGAMTLVAPEPILGDDEHHRDNPAQSLRRPSEIVPWRRRVDVTAHGFACTAGGDPLPATSVRLAIYRGQQALLDKSLYVYGDREMGPDGRPGAPEPFSRMPLAFERARRTDANPNGVDPDRDAPNLHDPKQPDAAAGFGPISRYSKGRRALLGTAERSALEAAEPVLPVGFDGAYFQSAPSDQQLAQLNGDEWVILDGFDADHRRIASQLPFIRAEALVMAVDAEGAAAIGADRPLRYRPIRLAIDGLHLDGEVGRATITWRGSLTVSSAKSLPSLRAVAAIARGQESIAWPAPDALGRLEADAIARAGPDAIEETASMEGRAPGPTLPFVEVEWGTPGAKPVPQIIGAGTVTYADASGTTMTLSAEQRGRIVEALPFRQPEGTREPDGTADAMLGLGADGPSPAGPSPAGPSPDGPSPAGPSPAGPAVAGEVAVEASRFFHEPTRQKGAEPPPQSEPGARDIPLIPERTTEGIPIERQCALHIAYMPWRHRPPRDSLTVMVKGSFEIVPGGVATLVEEPDLPTGDLSWDDEPHRSLRYPSDFAYFKPRADVVLVGHAYAPWADEGDKRRAGVATQVSFQFGRDDQTISRKLAIFGERRWEKAFLTLAPSEPEPFEKMPLVYERAFGGPDWRPNPVGVGRGAERGPDDIARLPNLENPDDLIDSPGDAPRPACLGPIHPLWGPRQRGLGTYDSQWLRERWPFFPDDFDWSHFQCAPPEQRLETIVGDEPFVITGVHPELTHLEGRLPGIQPRCFMAVDGDEAGAPGAEVAFERVALRLDTVVFDTDAMRIHLVWRGVIEVADERASEIRALFLLADGPGEETTPERAYARFLAAVAPMQTVEASPEEEVAPANDVDEGDEKAAAELAALEAKIGAMVEQQQRTLAEAGIESAAKPPEPQPLDADALAASLRTSGTSEQDIAEVLAALEPRAPEDEPVPTTPRERADARLATDSGLEQEDLRDGELDDLDFSGRSLAGCDLRGAQLRRARFVGANLTMALLDGADLTDADLTGAHLTQASLCRATVTRARFDEAVLDGIDLTEAQGRDASLRRCTGRGARLSEGDWTNARFDDATLGELRLDGATLDGTSFVRADLTEALLFDGQGNGANFSECTLTDALCDGLQLPGGNLFRVRARGAVWEGAVLTDASFLEAELTECSFVSARLDGADLSATDLTDARMKRVHAKEARFVKSNLLRAQLEKSDLRGADFTGASLYGCEVWESDTDGAVFTDALVAMSKLEGRR